MAQIILNGALIEDERNAVLTKKETARNEGPAVSAPPKTSHVQIRRVFIDTSLLPVPRPLLSVTNVFSTRYP